MVSTMRTDPEGFAAGLREHLRLARSGAEPGLAEPGVTLSMGEIGVVIDLLEELAEVYAGTGLARLAAELAADLGRRARRRAGGADLNGAELIALGQAAARAAGDQVDLIASADHRRGAESGGGPSKEQE